MYSCNTCFVFSSYERKEDEEREQKKVDDYFKNVLLPSPWLENRTADMLKRVTFSPHPPALRYILQDGSDDSSGAPVNYSFSSNSSSSTAGSDSSSFNTNDSANNNRNDPSGKSSKKKTSSDACCQTMLTFPTDLNLLEIISKEFFSYHDESCTSKELVVSSLRRKLFGQDSVENTPTKRSDGGVGILVDDSKNHPTTAYVTSSPSKDGVKTPLQRSDTSMDEDSPSISPLGSFNRDNGTSSLTDSGFSPKKASNIGTPAWKRADISLSSVDVSPIGTDEKPQKPFQIDDDDDVEESSCNFLRNVSFDGDGTEESVFESSRAAIFESPDISPIKVETKSTRVNHGMFGSLFIAILISMGSIPPITRQSRSILPCHTQTWKLER